MILARKMLRDITHHKTQFLSIFVMAFLAAFIYAGVGAEWRGIERSANDFYASTRLADAWVLGQGFSEEQARRVERAAGVAAVERRYDVDAVALFEDDPENRPRLTLSFAERGELSAPHTVSGKPFDGDDAGGVWLAARFAEARGLKPGDTLRLEFDGMSFAKTIRGLVYSPEYVFLSTADTLTPDFGESGYAWLSPKAFPAPAEFVFTTLLIEAESQTESASRPALKSAVTAALGNDYLVYLAQRDHPSVAMFANEVTQHKMLGDIFPVVFVLIALLTILTTMTRIVTNQRLQIGTLAALGFSRGRILRHYTLYGFMLTTLGAVCGIVVGPLTIPRLFFPTMSSFYTLPDWRPAFDDSFIVAAVAVLLLATAMTWLMARRLLGERPAATLRPRAPKSFGHGPLERTALWRRLGFTTQWNLRDASRNRARSLMAVVGVFGCTALVISGLAMLTSMGDLKMWQYEVINRFASKLVLSPEATGAQIEQAKERVDGEAVMESTAMLRAGATERSGALTVLDDVSLIQLTDGAMHPLSLPADGVLVSRKLADALGLAAGDRFEWHASGDDTWITSTVSAINRDPASQGITMSREHYEELGERFAPTALISAQEVTGSFEGVESILSSAAIVEGWDALTEGMNRMIAVLLLAAALLSIVVLYNLGLLQFTEMQREMSTLKVLGFGTPTLRRLLLTQNLWFSALGFLLGIPAGYELLHRILAYSGDEFDFPVFFHPEMLVTALVFTFALSFGVNRLFSSRIHQLDMVESIKALG